MAMGGYGLPEEGGGFRSEEVETVRAGLPVPGGCARIVNKVLQQSTY